MLYGGTISIDQFFLVKRSSLTKSGTIHMQQHGTTYVHQHARIISNLIYEFTFKLQPVMTFRMASESVSHVASFPTGVTNRSQNCMTAFCLYISHTT